MLSWACCAWMQCIDRWCIGTITSRSRSYELGMPSSALPTVSCDGGGWQGGVLKGWAWTRLYFLWGIACFSSMDIAGSGRRNKQTFSSTPPPTSSTPHFLQGWACSQKRFCDWCLPVLCVYLFVWQTNALLTSHCHMLSSQCILRLHQCRSIQVQIS